MPRRKRTKDSLTNGENNLSECYLRSKPKKGGYRKRMHGIWKQEGMKEVMEQQLCDQRRQIEEKHWLDEQEMETFKQKIEGRSTTVTDMVPVVQIETEEEYVELVGTESDDKTFYGDWSDIGLESTDERPETQCRRRHHRGSRIEWD